MVKENLRPWVKLLVRKQSKAFEATAGISINPEYR
jgi:hypothetical protein